MSELLEKIKTPITTIPGIGNVIGATILGEIGDINRFSNASKLVAVGAVARKLCYTIFTILKNNVAYEIQEPIE